MDELNTVEHNELSSGGDGDRKGFPEEGIGLTGSEGW